MFDKKSEYALNKYDQDSIIYICPIPLCGELRHLLVDEPLLLLRHPELHLDVPLSVYHSASPPFLIRVWDYPSKQFSCLGAGVPLNRKSASGYSLAVLAIVTLPSFSPLSILQYLKGFLASAAKKSMAITEIQMEYFQTEWSSRP